LYDWLMDGAKVAHVELIAALTASQSVADPTATAGPTC